MVTSWHIVGLHHDSLNLELDCVHILRYMTFYGDVNLCWLACVRGTALECLRREGWKITLVHIFGGADISSHLLFFRRVCLKMFSWPSVDVRIKDSHSNCPRRNIYYRWRGKISGRGRVPEKMSIFFTSGPMRQSTLFRQCSATGKLDH